MKGLKDFFRERVAGISKVDPNNPEKGNKGVIYRECDFESL